MMIMRMVRVWWFYWRLDMRRTDWLFFWKKRRVLRLGSRNSLGLPRIRLSRDSGPSIIWSNSCIDIGWLIILGKILLRKIDRPRFTWNIGKLIILPWVRLRRVSRPIIIWSESHIKIEWFNLLNYWNSFLMLFVIFLNRYNQPSLVPSVMYSPDYHLRTMRHCLWC